MGRTKKRKQVEKVDDAVSSEEEFESWTFRCRCTSNGSPQADFDDEQPMIECEKCQEWTHSRCNQLHRCKKYVCTRCVGTKASEGVSAHVLKYW